MIHIRGVDDVLWLMICELADGGYSWQEKDVDGETVTLAEGEFENMLNELGSLQENTHSETDLTLLLERLEDIEVRGTDVNREDLTDLISSETTTTDLDP